MAAPAAAATLGRRLVSTPIFYVNGSPHIGHLHSALLANAVSRWEALRGRPAAVSSGTDEHGLKVQQAADAAGVDRLGFCSRVSGEFERLFEAAQVQPDVFVRTTEPRHARAVAALWERLAAGGHIYLAEHEGWYSTVDEAFVPPSQVNATGTDGLQWLSEDNYKFRLAGFAGALEDWLSQPGTVVPEERRNEALAMVRDGQLQDLSVSRLAANLQWAIPVPGDAAHVVYVWLDALTNYLTVCGYPDALSADAWPPRLQILGKDILKFHAVIWPAVLMAAGLALPQQLAVHAHWTVDSAKMSKSVGNVVDPQAELDAHGVDPVRYYMLAEASLADDSNWESDGVERRWRADMVNKLGNLVARCTSAKLVGGAGTHTPVATGATGGPLLDAVAALPDEVDALYGALDFRGGTAAVMRVLDAANASVSQQEPWRLRKEGRDADADAVVHAALEAARVACACLQPVVPETAERIGGALGGLAFEVGGGGVELGAVPYKPF